MKKGLLVVSLLATAFFVGGTASAQQTSLELVKANLAAIHNRAQDLESGAVANSARGNLAGLWNAVEADEKGDSQALGRFVSKSSMPAVSSTPAPMASPTMPEARVQSRPERASAPARPSIPTPPSSPIRTEPRETQQAVAPELPTPIPAKAAEKPISNKVPLLNPTAIKPQPPVKQAVASKPIPNREVKEARYLFDKRGPEGVRNLSHRFMRESPRGMTVQDFDDRSREHEEPLARIFVEKYVVPTKELLDESESRRLPSSPGYTEK